MEHAKEQERVHTARKYIKIILIRCPHRHQMTRRKFFRMTNLIQVQGKKNQALDILY